jgi:GNAT superfamily N-acetyltransferase
VEIRRADTDAELTALLELRNRVHPDDPLALAEVRGLARQVKGICHFVAREEGRPVGAAEVGIAFQKPEPFAQIWVPSEERRRGIGSALYRELSGWAREQGQSLLETWIEDSQPEGLDFAVKRGFTEIGLELRVSLDLTAIEAPKVEPPEGIEIVSWADRPELARALYDVALEASPDIPGDENEEMEPYEDWLAHEMQGAGDRPEATFVAVAGDEVVGYSKFSLTNAQPTVAHHDLTGVKRAWRRRGIARALKQAQIAWAKESGYERLETRNEERNEPIRRLNTEFGYRPSGARILFRGPVES